MLHGALALGVIITALNTGFGTDSLNYMFGSILAMTTFDVILSVILSIVLVIIYFIFYNRLLLISFDEKFAKSSGISVTFYQFLIALITAFVVVLGMRMMGTLLISSLIVFPAVIAKKLTKSFKGLACISVITSIICFILGILVSFYLNLPAGAAIVAIYIILLFIVNIVSSIIKI